ncbi:MAG: hypothetical protein U5K51_06370 [Flavobacteriaceae bacterium]|nr:hypothetical protein [Flavobacteriaceae bacterium]
MRKCLIFIPILFFFFLSECSSGQNITEINEKESTDQSQAIQRIAQLKAAGYDIVDYHAHLKGGLTMEELLDHSKKTGIRYGVAFNAGIGFPITDDANLIENYKKYKDYPVYMAMQAEGREWVNMFSKESISTFDYVFTDAMTWTDRKGRRMRLWMPEGSFCG